MMRPTMTMVGIVGADPVLTFGQRGDAKARFRIAYTPRVKGDDGVWKDADTTTWVTVVAWRTLAENVADSITKGSIVIVSGVLRMWEGEFEGRKTFNYDLNADEVGLALSNASASVQRNSPKQQQKTDAPWSETPAQRSSEDMF